MVSSYYKQIYFFAASLAALWLLHQIWYSHVMKPSSAGFAATTRLAPIEEPVVVTEHIPAAERNFTCSVCPLIPTLDETDLFKLNGEAKDLQEKSVAKLSQCAKHAEEFTAKVKSGSNEVEPLRDAVKNCTAELQGTWTLLQNTRAKIDSVSPSGTIVIVLFIENLERMRAIQQTWGSPGDLKANNAVLELYSDHMVACSPAMTASCGLSNTVERTVNAFRCVKSAHPNAAWYVFVTDQTWMYLGNLRERLNLGTYDPNRAVRLGYPFRRTESNPLRFVHADVRAGEIFSNRAMAIIAAFDFANCRRGLQNQPLPQTAPSIIGFCFLDKLHLRLTPFSGLHPDLPEYMVRDLDLFADDMPIASVWPLGPSIGDGVAPLTYGQYTAKRMQEHYAALDGRIPHIMHQIWVGKRRGVIDRLVDWMQTMNPGWAHHFWTDENLPKCYAPKLLERETKHAAQEKESKLQMADILRLHALYMYGGVYLDADFAALKPLSSYVDALSGSSAYLAKERDVDNGWISNGVLMAPQYSEFILEYMIWQMFRQHEADPAWVRLGPMLLTFISDLSINPVKLLPAKPFYPYHHEDVIDEHLMKAKNSLMIQFWGSTLNLYGTEYWRLDILLNQIKADVASKSRASEDEQRVIQGIVLNE